jgi:hypothetical protein
MNPPLSVVLAVRNDKEYCREAVESILQQTFADFEFIVIDDGSTDDTPLILQECAAKDRRIRLTKCEHRGTAMSRNAGIDLASGAYIACMDGDDRSLPHRLHVLYSVLESDPDVGLVGGNSEVIDEKGRIIGYRVINTADANVALRRRCIYQGGDVVFRKDLYRAVGGYRAGFHFCEDYDLWLRMSDRARAVKVPDITYQWRVNSNSMTLTKMSQSNREADFARSFADERRATGRDSYSVSLEAMSANAAEDRKDTTFASLWIALLKLRDLGKAAAADDLKRVLRMAGRPKWKLLAWVFLRLPHKVSRSLLG